MIAISLLNLWLSPPILTERAQRVAIEICRAEKNDGISVHEQITQKIICLSGPISRQNRLPTLSPIDVRPGILVLRSGGGDAAYGREIAIALSKLPNLSVIVDNYCLSSCAAYLIWAGNRLYLTQDDQIYFHPAWPVVPLMADSDALLTLHHNLLATPSATLVWQSTCEITKDIAFLRARGVDYNLVYAPAILSWDRKISSRLIGFRVASRDLRHFVRPKSMIHILADDKTSSAKASSLAEIIASNRDIVIDFANVRANLPAITHSMMTVIEALQRVQLRQPVCDGQ